MLKGTPGTLTRDSVFRRSPRLPTGAKMSLNCLAVRSLGALWIQVTEDLDLSQRTLSSDSHEANRLEGESGRVTV